MQDKQYTQLNMFRYTLDEDIQLFRHLGLDTFCLPINTKQHLGVVASACGQGNTVSIAVEVTPQAMKWQLTVHGEGNNCYTVETGEGPLSKYLPAIINLFRH